MAEVANGEICAQSPVMPDPSSPGQLDDHQQQQQQQQQQQHVSSSGEQPVARALVDDFELIATAEAVRESQTDGHLQDNDTAPILQAAHVEANQQVLDIHALAKRVSEHTYGATICDGEDIVVLLGKTGNGKSTTMNWCMGKTLVETATDETDRYADTVLAVEGEELLGCEIGQGGDSKTEFLQAYRVPYGLTLCDTPGWNDTGGSEIELEASIAIVKVLQTCKSARIVVSPVFLPAGFARNPIPA